MKRQKHKSITDLGWWKHLSKRTDKELEWWFHYEKDVRKHGPNLNEIRRRQRPHKIPLNSYPIVK